MTNPLSGRSPSGSSKALSTSTRQRETVLWLWKNPGKWYTYPKDFESVEMVCALVNLGIAEVKAGKWTLKSAPAAKQFLGKETKS